MVPYLTRRPHEPIALIGTGLRFPGNSNTPEKLWDLLRHPRDVQSVIPANRFNIDGFYNSNGRQSTSATRHGYFLGEDHRHFDADFFGIKPIEANSMDPQQRMLLEVIYEGIEAAGLSMESLRGSSTAVYVGLMSGDYGDMLNRDPSDFPPYLAAGTARSMMSNRVSYVFDWRGPSMTIDTACSSSLVAVHHAVQSLRSGECQVAVAAGANLILGPEQFIAGSNMKMMSPDGRSYMWDSRANGYARGEGIAAVVLKTLSAAIADGDNVECVIVETGLNQDGRTNGLTVPSAAAQTALIENTYSKAGLDLNNPSDRPQYFEAHGTGTPAGDPVETQAIHDAFFKSNKNDSNHPSEPLYCGSIKTIIGHTEGTAGLAGLIKTSLALKHGIIPPNRLFQDLAPNVKPFYKNLEITTKAKAWPKMMPDTVRRASVNSFGFGGTNAHCILESYSPENLKRVESSTSHLPFVFSAASEKSLLAVLWAYSRYLKTQPSYDLEDLSYTLCCKRTSLPIRVAFTADDVEELFVKIDAYIQGSGAKSIVAALVCPSTPRVLGIFTGQGAQWAGMARKLMQFPAASKIIEDLESSLAELPDPPAWSLKAELSKDASCSRVPEAAIAQPICTAVQILLVEMLRAAGVRFSAVVGHSSGEIAAAFAADRLSARDAIRIAYYRGVHLPLVGGVNGEAGAMVAVGASYEEAQDICDSERFRGRLCVGASNSAASVTLSGDAIAVQEVKEMFHAQNRFARLLKVDNAYHSHHMTRCSEAITASVRACNVVFKQPFAPDCAWVSSVDMKPMTNDLDISDYWHRNTIGCVFFSQALDHALKLSRFDLAVEIGAHPALKGPALQVIEGVYGRTIPYTGMLSRNIDDVKAFSDGLAYIWANIREHIVSFANYSRFLGGPDRVRQPKNLPSYPWDHERPYWYQSRKSHMYSHQPAQHELLGMQTSDYSSDHIAWKNYLVARDIPWIQGHCIQGQMVFPGSAYIVSAFEAAREAMAGQSLQAIELMNVTFGQSLFFESEDARVETLIMLSGIQRRKSILTANFTYHSIGSHALGPMSLNASCQVRVVVGPSAEPLHSPAAGKVGMIDIEEERIYASLANCGYQYSGAFKALHSVKRKIDVASGMIHNTTSRLLIHPATLDAAIHSIAVAYSYPGDGRLTSVLLPIDIFKISLNLSQAIASANDTVLKFTSSSRDDGEGDVDVYSADGSNSILRLKGLRTKPMVPATPANDIHMFSETVWGPASPVLEITLEQQKITKPGKERELKTISAIARQISHRYPAMSILNISACAVDATQRFLTSMDGAFASYTYTDTSSDFLEHAKLGLNLFEDKIVYKTMNMDVDLANQGFAQHSYDLVVAFPGYTDTTDLAHKVRTIRRLLKPGGFFLCPNLVDIRRLVSNLSTDVAMGESVDLSCDGPLLPLMSNATQTQMLDRYGFAAIEWLANSGCVDPNYHPVMLLQAIDDRVRFLREPLNLANPPLQFSEITLVGGATSATSSCFQNLTRALGKYSNSLTNFETLSMFVDDDISFGGNVVLVQDHDKHVFEDFDEATLRGLQRLLKTSRNVLWVTHGYQDNSPHARMLVGFVRCLIQEMPHIRLQIMDLPTSETLDATLISENLIRLLLTGRWEDEGRLADMLWSAEPEISYLDGRQSIPRVKLSHSRNSRYNSSRRLITHSVDSHDSHITVLAEDGRYVLKAKAETNSRLRDKQADTVSIRISHSSLKAIKIMSSGYQYVVLGNDITTQEQVVALSDSLSNVVDVPRDLVKPCPLTLMQKDAMQYLQSLAHGLLSGTALRDLAPGQSLLVLDPSEGFAGVLASHAAAQDVRVAFVANEQPKHTTVGTSAWKQMPPCASKREMRSLLSRSIPSRVIVWGDSDWTSEVCEMIPDCVPVESSRRYLATRGTTTSSTTMSKLSAAFDLVQARLAAMKDPFLSGGPGSLPLASLQGTPVAIDGTTMIDWSSPDPILMRVEAAEQNVRFRCDRTYWLVGLTGDLGLSLCEWMIARNATHIVLSSRNPDIDSQWVARCASLGATVKVYACDVTDFTSVQSVYDTVKETLPLIGGVCHGAMVLRDALVQDLDMPQVEEVLKPKVNGAINLDRVVQGDNLDFFVMLSSIAAIIGNPGQAAYAAGNGFLAALTAQRRARGEAASCIAMGAILGAGYATRGLTLSQQRSLEKAGVMWTSQQDFHCAFAEAVLASPPQPGLTAEFGTGVPMTYTDQEYKPKHADNPIFSHLLLQRMQDGLSISENPTLSTKAQLLGATTSEAVSQILENFLTPRLIKALQLTPDATVIDQTAESLGIDSLIAVEMRSWMIKELNIDMPILVVIGGNTMRAILAHCAEMLDPSMTPLLNSAPQTAVTRSPVSKEARGSQSKLVEQSTAPHSNLRTSTDQLITICGAASPDCGELKDKVPLVEPATVQYACENESSHATPLGSAPAGTATFESTSASFNPTTKTAVVTTASRNSTQGSSTQSQNSPKSVVADEVAGKLTKRIRILRFKKAFLKRLFS